MTVPITGATGLVGTRLVRRLVGAGEVVNPTDDAPRPSSRSRESSVQRAPSRMRPWKTLGAVISTARSPANGVLCRAPAASTRRLRQTPSERPRPRSQIGDAHTSEMPPLCVGTREAGITIPLSGRCARAGSNMTCGGRGAPAGYRKVPADDGVAGAIDPALDVVVPDGVRSRWDEPRRKDADARSEVQEVVGLTRAAVQMLRRQRLTQRGAVSDTMIGAPAMDDVGSRCARSHVCERRHFFRNGKSMTALCNPHVCFEQGLQMIGPGASACRWPDAPHRTAWLSPEADGAPRQGFAGQGACRG